MAGFLADAVLDGAIAVLISNVTTVYLCSQQPTTYAEASSTYALGNRAITLGAVENGVSNGRRTRMSAFVNGTATASGTATHYAFTSGSVLYATQALASSVAITSAVDFPLAEISVTIPDAV